MKIVATTSLPAVDRPNADRWNAARSRQKLTTPEKKREYSMLSYLVKTKASETINQTRNQTRENQSSETKPTPSQNQNKPANLQIKVKSQAVPDLKSFLKHKKLDREQILSASQPGSSDKPESGDNNFQQLNGNTRRCQGDDNQYGTTNWYCYIAKLSSIFSPAEAEP